MLGRQQRLEIIILALVGETQFSSVPLYNSLVSVLALEVFLPDMAPFKDPQ